MAQLFQINSSRGGVPKTACHEAEVNKMGLVEDDQADKKHHGGLERAVSLYSLEHILVLQKEGHPIFPGSTGENLTVSGLDWTQMVPGTQLQIGAGPTAVRLTVTSFATPCQTIRRSFQNDQFKRISQKVHPGWSRAYARVDQGGKLRTGAPITLIASDGG
jgi:MOSC domain-containing protein YiiM